MISCQKFFEILEKQGITFFTGIPDSTFKDWMSFLADNDNLNLQNLVACNECLFLQEFPILHLKIGCPF